MSRGGTGKVNGTAQTARRSGLVGREPERRRLDALLDAARAGRSGVLVVRGEAGVGKTTLLNHAADRAGGMWVLRACGVEAEAGLAFSGLDQLVRPVLELLVELPERQAGALRAALALSEPAEVDRFAVYAATVGLLGAAAEHSPVLALVDDAHWLDGASADALTFAGRRLEAEGIALVFAARDRDPDEFVAPGFEELHLHGLDAGAVASVLQRCGGRAAPEVAERLATETAGNPLALIELAELLTPAQLAGEEVLPEPLAAGDVAQRAFLRRARRLSAAAQAALVVAAAAGDGELGALLAALGGIRLGSGSLAEVEAAGLVRLGDGRVVFEHPLVRSAVYAAAEPAQRRAAHRALADVRGQRADRRAWHLAHAAFGPDEEVAVVLEQAAEAARRRTGYASAADALERAAQLSPPGQRRIERLIAGAEMARQGGQLERALGLLADAGDEATDPSVLADIAHKRGRVEWTRGRPRHAAREYVDAAAGLEATDLSSAVSALLEASMAAHDAGDTTLAVDTARKAHHLADGDSLLTNASQALVGVNLYWTGEPAEAHKLLSQAITTFDCQRLAEVDSEFGVFVSAWRVWTGVNVERSRMFLEDFVNTARAAGALGLLPYALDVYARVLVRDGQWDSAYVAIGEGTRIAAELGTVPQHQQLLGALALIEAAQGREKECRAHAEQALALMRGSELGTPIAPGEALGLLELGAGRPDRALQPLELATAARGTGQRKRLARPSLGDLVEAHVLSGGPAPTELTAALRRARDGDFDGSQAVVERSLGLLSSDMDLDVRFTRALELHGSAWPFARARTHLSYGERLRRAGRRVDARDHLHAALETFERLGARPWAERARRELRASGERFARRDPTAPEQLTPQELQIALLVARGATNREAAAAVFLSPKTVEYHLSQVYRKLGLRSRTELARALRHDQQDRPDPTVHVAAT